jgi:hypothetical protein
MRSLVPYAAIFVLSLTIEPVRAASSADSDLVDQQRIEALEAKASQAQPREQPFLYAQLVQQMTELSIRQYAAGDIGKATGMLKDIQKFAQKIHLSLGNNDKRIKNAEILLNRTAFRLNEMLQSSNLEDRPLVKQTLAQVNQAQSATMMELFQK